MQSVNIFSVDKPEGRLDVARVLGSSALMMFVYDLDPGRSSSPYHYEYEEEWLLVIEGTLVLRAPDGEGVGGAQGRFKPGALLRARLADDREPAHPGDGAGGGRAGAQAPDAHR